MAATEAGDFLDSIGLECPVVQAGMGGGVAGGALAGAVSAAGGLGTVGIMAPGAFGAALRQARRIAGRRPLAANLLTPFIRKAHIDACAEAEVALVVLHGGIPARWIARLRARQLKAFVTVGTARQAARAVALGAEGLVVQGVEAGGHNVGVQPVERALADVLEIAGGMPVFAAGGVAERGDVRRLQSQGAAAAVAGTIFLLAEESAAHPVYKERVIGAAETLLTRLFSFGWPLPHRVIPNELTERWCARHEEGPLLALAVGRLSAPVGRLTPLGAMGRLAAIQRPEVPLFTPALPLAGMPESAVDRTALYAGQTVSRLQETLPAAEVLARLAPR